MIIVILHTTSTTKYFYCLYIIQKISFVFFAPPINYKQVDDQIKKKFNSRACLCVLWACVQVQNFFPRKIKENPTKLILN